MTYFKWTPDFDVKVQTMNDQHKVLIDIMDKLYELNDNGANKRDIQHKLDELGAYTRKHFADEERYMDSIDFEGRDRHKIIHKHLLTELDRHTTNFKELHQSLSEDFFFFLKHWLSSHIKHIDIKYGNVSSSLATLKAG